MSSNDDEGPLTRLMRGLGLKPDLAPIAAVKRIEEVPVSLNPECFFKMTPSPKQMSPADVNRLWEEGPKLPTEIDLRDCDIRFEFKGSFRGRQIWICWDAKEGQEVCGEGESQEMALVDFMEQRPKPRASRVIFSSPFEPNEYSDKRDVDFDDGLDPDDAR